MAGKMITYFECFRLFFMMKKDTWKFATNRKYIILFCLARKGHFTIFMFDAKH